MQTIEIDISDCTESDIVARDVVNSNGIIILVKNATITDYIKKRLIEIGIENICIYNSINNLVETDNFTNNLS
ncbi:MAG TPA: hypothetical protein VFC70_04835, partial [Oscillospiraceae bacterium]|nr:hypothetical protein [Oscillospiraceae bacterium]